MKPRCNDGRRSTFAGNRALLLSDVMDSLIDFGGKPAVSLLGVMLPRRY